MNEEQLIKDLIKQGESEQLEFKEVVHKEYIAKTKLADIKQKFRDSGLEFIEEVHISKDPYTKKNVFNETLENLYNIFSERNQFDEFINYQLNRFLEDSSKA